MPLPTSKRALDRTLGIFAYYSKWVHRFSEKAFQMFKTTTFPLNEPAVDAFKSLKQETANAVVTSFEEDVPFEVENRCARHRNSCCSQQK